MDDIPESSYETILLEWNSKITTLQNEMFQIE
jgi:hypothetical protein